MSPKASKCKKAENACKICLQTVTPKTGLQCTGACRSWLHYECVSYTPGKIRDIKDGIIKVTCPCPDCETQLPKEYRVDNPTCANHLCPANIGPRCEQDTCPSSPLASFHDTMNQTSAKWPMVECGAECKKYLHDSEDPPQPWPSVKCGPECKRSRDADVEFPPPKPKPQPIRRRNEGLRGDCRESVGTPSFSVVGQMCSTIGLLARQMDELMAKVQDIAKVTGGGGGGGGGGGYNSQGGCHDPPPCKPRDKKPGDKSCNCPSNPR